MNRKSGVVLSYLFMVFEVLSTLLLTPIIIRTLGQAEYGVYKLIVSVNAYLLLLDLGVGNAIIRYISKYRAEEDINSERKFFGVALIYYFIIAIIVIVCGLILIEVFPTVFAKGLTDDEVNLGKILLSVTIINSAVTLGTTAFNNVIVAYENFSVSKGTAIIFIIIRIVLTYIIIKLGFGSIGIVVTNLLITILTRTVYVLYVIFKIRLIPIFKNIEFSFIKEIALYSSLILLQMIATQINASADMIILGMVVSSSSAIIGVYSIGTQIVQYFQSIGTSFTSVLMPGIMRLVTYNKSKDAICSEMIRVGRFIFMVLGLIFICFLVFGKQFIILWAGNDNYNAYYVAVILMSAYLFIMPESVGSQVLWALNMHKEQSYLKILIVFINIVLTVILIKWSPLIGATIGTFISLFFGEIFLMNIIFYKKLRISIKNYYKGMFKGIIPCLFMTLFVGLIISQLHLTRWYGFVINILVMIIFYCLIIYKYGLNNYEIELIKSVINSIYKKVRREI